MKNMKEYSITITMIIILASCSITPIISGDQEINSQNNPSFVPINVAIEVANQKIQSLGKANIYTVEPTPQVIKTAGEEITCYVFNLQPTGYMIVSAYYELPPVIAYSFHNELSLPLTGDNHFFQLIKYDMNLRYNALQSVPNQMIDQRLNQWQILLNPYTEGDQQKDFQQWPPENSTPTEGWILTNWHQNAPYNNFCPMDQNSGSRSLAGCPAVTMAQILNYHATTNDVWFTDDDDYYHNYGGNQYWIDDDSEIYDFPSFPVLNSYLDAVADKYENNDPLNSDDKAAITFACGVAAHQVYSSSGSGTFGVNQAYDAYTKFNFTTHVLLDESNSDLYPRLAWNIKNATPAHLAVVNPEWTAGHNLVIDGYNTDNYYHLNFGWGGSYNGWYLLPDEMPYDLTVIEGVILDIITEEVQEPQQIDIPISTNWNFFSIPLNQTLQKTNLTITVDQTNYTWNEAVAGGIISSFVFGWNRAGQNYEFSDTFQPGYGYWIYAYENCLFCIDNISLDYTEYVTTTDAGWNTIGLPYNQSVDKTNVLVNDVEWNTAVSNGWISDFVFGWNRIGQNYEFSNIFVPGFSYWLYTPQSCEIIRN